MRYTNVLTCVRFANIYTDPILFWKWLTHKNAFEYWVHFIMKNSWSFRCDWELRCDVRIIGQILSRQCSLLDIAVFFFFIQICHFARTQNKTGLPIVIKSQLVFTHDRFQLLRRVYTRMLWEWHKNSRPVCVVFLSDIINSFKKGNYRTHFYPFYIFRLGPLRCAVAATYHLMTFKQSVRVIVIH